MANNYDDNEYAYSTSSATHGGGYGGGYSWSGNTNYWYKTPTYSEPPPKIKITDLYQKGSFVTVTSPAVVIEPHGLGFNKKTLHVSLDLDEESLQVYNGCTTDLADAIVHLIRANVKNVLLEYNKEQREKQQGGA